MGPLTGSLGLQGAWGRAKNWPTILKTGFKGLGAVGWQPTGLRTGFKGLGAVGWQPRRLNKNWLQVAWGCSWQIKG